MLSADDVRERQEAVRRQAEQTRAEIARYRQAREHFEAREQRARRFAPLSPTQQRWRGLRDNR